MRRRLGMGIAVLLGVHVHPARADEPGACAVDGAVVPREVGLALESALALQGSARVRLRAVAEVPIDDARRLALAAQPGALGEFGLRELGRLHTPEAMGCLIDALSRSDGTHRAAAARSLAEQGDRARIAVLLRLAARDPDPRVRSAAEEAVLALGAAPSAPENVDAALRALHAATGEDARIRAIEALARTGDGRAVLPVVERLGDPSPPVALAAARVLRETAWMHDPRAVPALVAQLGRPGSGAAAVASVVRAWRPLGAVDAYVAELVHEDPRRRSLAVTVLGAIAPLAGEGAGGPHVDTLLVRALADHDEGVRRAVRTTLVTEERIPLTPALLAGLLADRSPFLRAEAAVALAEGLHRRAQGGAAVVTPLLVERLRDREVLVRLSVADALRAIGARSAEADVRAAARRVRGDARAHLVGVADALAGSPAGDAKP